MAVLVLAIGLGTGTWWYLPVMFAVIVAEGVLIGAHRRATGTTVPASAWPAWMWAWSMSLVAVPVLVAGILHFTGTADWIVVVVAALGGVATGFGSAAVTLRWEASRLEP
ncbi:hypothetical protein [Microbacterium mangrovi]|nr:hypothetical protein [Microbacterium mangrovi]